jgi:hypothetical protein
VTTFSAQLLLQGAASIDDLEAAIELMVLHGGHLSTNLLDAGILREEPLRDLLADVHALERGPAGRLPDPPEAIWETISPATALRFGVFPLERRDDALVLAVEGPLRDEDAARLGELCGVPLAFRQVTPLRLDEALFRHAGGPLSERDRWLLAMLNAGHQPRRGDRQRLAQGMAETGPSTAPYRRMSEHPEGIARSSRQPEPHLPDPDEIQAEVEPHLATIAEGGPITRPYEDVSRPAQSSAPPGEKRVTQPYTTDGTGEPERRNTQPWSDEEEEDEPPMSVTGEFSASLSAEVPPSVEARIHEEQRGFRHRGPFTRAQAELAASQAHDVNTVLEVLVRYARQFFERCILFTVVGQEAELRLAHGLTADLATLRVNLEEAGLLAEAFRKGDPIVWSLGHEGSDEVLRSRLGVVGEQSVAVVPLCIRERVVAVFYGDDRSEDVHTPAVEDCTDFTEICAVEITRIIVARKRRGDG